MELYEGNARKCEYTPEYQPLWLVGMLYGTKVIQKFGLCQYFNFLFCKQIEWDLVAGILVHFGHFVKSHGIGNVASTIDHFKESHAVQFCWVSGTFED